MRSSLIGSLVEVLRVNLARKATRVRVFEVGRVFLRDPGAAAGDAGVAGVSQPMRARRPRLRRRREPLQWGERERAGRLLRREGRRRGAARAAPAPRFVPAAASGAAPGAQRAHRARRPAGRLRRRAASALAPGLRAAGGADAVRARWRGAARARRAELRAAAAPAIGVARHRADRRRCGDARGADAMSIARRGGAAGCARPACSTSTSRAAPTADIGAGERSLALRLELRDEDATLTDERIEAVVAAVLAALRAAPRRAPARH